MTKSSKKAKPVGSRHAAPVPTPAPVPLPDKPPSGGTTPNDPCAIASAIMEENLQRMCRDKFNHMDRGCCCDLSPEDQGLPHLEAGGDLPIYNTATNGAGIGTQPVGTADSLWEVGAGNASGPSSVTAWVPATVTTEAGAWVDAGSDATTPVITNADWISYDANHGNGTAGTWYYRLRFVLCEGIDPSQFVLIANVLADNALVNIYVNGVAQNGDYSAIGFQAETEPLSLANNWQHCANEVIFQVFNESGPTGFLAVVNFAGLPEMPAQQPCGTCECKPAELPDLAPTFCVAWGDSACDCFETNDLEVICITACNCFSNITFEELTIGPVTVTDEFGNPVPLLPDGMPSVEVIPYGPICFGDLGPCVKGQVNCKSRQVAIRTCGALPGKYRLDLGTICYHISYGSSTEACFEFWLCKD